MPACSNVEVLVTTCDGRDRHGRVKAMTAAGDLIAGRYRVRRPLAEGHLGHIWLGVDQHTGRTVALKKCALPGSLTEEQRLVLRVWVPREARAFARIRHPNVIRTLDVLLDGDAPWIVMEYVPSRSLYDVIRAEGSLPPRRVAAIGLDLLAALTAAWEADVLHLDVKPSNVLIAADGRVVLTDFGPAGSRAGVAALAQAGIILGSPQYVAPERLFGISDERSDLWSLGATLYHAAEGRTPFMRSTVDEGLHAADEGRPDPVYRAGPLAPVLFGLLRRDPAERLSAAAVRARLRRIAPPTRMVLARRAGTAAAAVSVLALGGAAAVIRSAGADQGAPPPPASVAPSPAPTLPAGFVRWTEPGGAFRVAVPRDWRLTPSAGGVVCTAPGGQPVLTVTQWTGDGSLLSALVEAEQATRRREPGYYRIRMSPATDPPGAVWEYTYRDPEAGAMRAQSRIVTVDGRSFRVDWRAPAAEWAAGLPTLLAVLPTVGRP
ncbi:serine/threonine-protein kinase [Actinoplanes sp. URMC 104]|uniref:serine/threonine-protein kinase n=1 Tax=Actinoplanes sp. URMC 104 TaxID=3423409 RepID=UPI003F19591F